MCFVIVALKTCKWKCYKFNDDLLLTDIIVWSSNHKECRFSFITSQLLKHSHILVKIRSKTFNQLNYITSACKCKAELRKYTNAF